MEDVLIFPFSGTAIEALDCLSEKQRCIGFISDDPGLQNTIAYGIKIFSRQAIVDFTSAKILAVNGSPTSFLERKEIIDSLGISDDRFCNIIHPKSAIGKNVELGYNVLIMAGVVITANAHIGNHVCLLPNSTIHHDSVIGNYTLIGGNVLVAGSVSIGDNCYLGGGCNIKNGISISTGTLIGMGSNVVKSQLNKRIIFGNPAK